MGIEFQCDECGKLLNIDTEPGASVTCHHCNASVVVPAALASLPKPQLEGGLPPVQPPAPQQDAEPDDDYLEEEDIASERDGVMVVMALAIPWIISIFFHLGIALILYLLVVIAGVEEPERSAIVPSAIFSEDPGGAISQGKTSKVTEAKQRHRKVKSSGDSKRELEIPNDGEKGETAELIGAAAGAGGGTLADYGLTDGGSGAGPRAGMYGTGGNAHHIVYLIDRSGSMFDTFDAVKREIAKSVGELQPVQDFHVIMFSDGEPKEKKPMALTPPTEKYKLALGRFLESIKAERTTNPIKGINRAFDVLAKADRRRPGKLIYMLTDGAFPDNDAVFAAIKAKNSRRTVLINTFLYGWKPPIAEEVMSRIARENGGRYRYVSPDE
ncbi:MAG: VWA domain-containing protein [Phycisphaerae bacterium]|jgi:Mg-chelatase subunit ChlD|nr:VWA domain-containing protein [Phycisphaerae bacterium]